MKNTIVNHINDLITFININKDNFIAFDTINLNWIEENRNFINQYKEDGGDYYRCLREFINLGELTIKSTLKKITQASFALDDEICSRIEKIILICKNDKFHQDRNANINKSNNAVITINQLREVIENSLYRIKQEGVLCEKAASDYFDVLKHGISHMLENVKNSSHQYDRKYDNILQHAESIIFKREEDKERQYGPFSENIAKCARIASEMCNKEITTEDFFKCMIALKIGRMAYNTKYDTLLDACGYIAGLDDYLRNEKNK